MHSCIHCGAIVVEVDQSLFAKPRWYCSLVRRARLLVHACPANTLLYPFCALVEPLPYSHTNPL
jgi:hypothetical protein